MAIDFKALGAKAASLGADMTIAQTGGGDYVPPAAGPCRVRFIAYAELGKQKGSFQGKPTVKDEVQLVFELSGKMHPPTENADGTKTPHRIAVTIPLSLNEKSHFFKLFQRMNYKGAAHHMSELLGDGYKAEVFHRAYKNKQGKEQVAAELFSKEGGFSIAPPRVEDDEAEGGWRIIPVAPALSPIRCFIWNLADAEHGGAEQWASLFIDGEYPERKDDKGVVIAKAKSKNNIQNKIMSAVNFQGSPIHTLLLSSGGAIDIPDAGEEDEGTEYDPANGEQGAGSVGAKKVTVPKETGSATAAASDSLGGIV